MRYIKTFLCATLLLQITIASASPCFLQQGQPGVVRIGRAYDSTDHVTVLPSLSIAAASVKIARADQTTLAAKNEATSCTAMTDGLYSCPVNGVDTGVLGVFTVSVIISGVDPMERECYVLSADAWATRYGASALYAAVSGIDTSLTNVGTDVTTILGDTSTDLPALINAADDKIDIIQGQTTTSGVAIVDNGITAAKIAANAFDSDAFTAAAITAFQSGLATSAGLTAAVADVSVDELQASALANLFDTNSGTTYGAAIAGSPVKEIVDNVSGGGGGGGDPWNTALPGAYTAGEAGYIMDQILQATTNTGVPINAAGVDSIWDEIIEPNGAVSARCAAAIRSALIYGEYLQTTSSGIGTVTARDQNGTSVRLTATVTSNGRNNITITCP